MFHVQFIPAGASKSRNETKRKTKQATPTIIVCASQRACLPLYKARTRQCMCSRSTATSGSFVSSSIVNQVRLYIAVYMCFYFLEGGKVIQCLARGPHPT